MSAATIDAEIGSPSDALAQGAKVDVLPHREASERQGKLILIADGRGRLEPVQDRSGKGI